MSKNKIIIYCYSISLNGTLVNGHSNYYNATINSNSYGSYSSKSNVSRYSSSFSYTTYSEKGSTIEYIEDKIVCIPAHSSKHFEEFEATSSVYIECGFPLNPSKTEEAILVFTENDSPIVFENRLTFILDDNEIPINHKFYVCEIQNILEDEIYKEYFRKDCNGNKITPPVLINTKASSDRYYLLYEHTNTNDNNSDNNYYERIR